jgi:hypothetical protein
MKETGVNDTIKMVDGDDGNKFWQRPLSLGGPLKGTEEKGQQILPTTGNPRKAGQDTSKLIVPEMPLPPQPPAEDD